MCQKLRGGIAVKAKRRRRQSKALSIAATVLMTFSLITPGIASAESSGKLHQSAHDSNKIAEAKVSDRLVKAFKDDDKVTFLVKFNEKADVMKVAKNARSDAAKASLSGQKAEHMQRSAVISELKTTALESQANVKAFLEEQEAKGNIESFKSYHIVNGMAVTATKEIAEKLATFAEVEKILPNEERELYDVTIDKEAGKIESELTNIEWNVDRVGAPSVWEMGFDGTGTVVASIDSGAQWDHPALQEKYRGYNNDTGEVDHTYSFFDATADEEEAYDDHGHGTHVTGTMVGSEPDGSNQVGVAPGAKWISAKGLNAAGSGYDTWLIAAAEWMLAPGGDASMAPDVVNNSWGGGPGLDEWYRDVVIAWRAAEIFPEFSAGNTSLGNPGGPGSVAVPANYPESFATGATDVNDVLAGFSLQGPSPYDEIKPEISAPGVNIRSSVPGGGYEGGWNGTSMAGPAVSAVVALLKQADASLTVDEIEEILTTTATPLTDDNFTEVPNNGYGHGLVNAYDAISSLVTGLGTLEGQVTKAGEDTEAPVFEHEGPSESYTGMDLNLSIQVSDNISVNSVNLSYTDQDGETQTVEAERVSGDYKEGEYQVTIPGEQIDGESLTYTWTINDFGNNEVTSDTYEVTLLSGVSVGFSDDFESASAGWTVFGENNSWDRGVPTSGPESAASGENVYATNLAGEYDSNTNTTLVMPPIDLPEGNAYLQFNQWYNIENNWDYGHVFISTDQEDWTQLTEITNTSDGWESVEVDLSEYSGQRVYIGFNLDTDGSVTRDGWYIDDVTLADTSNGESASLAKDRGYIGVVGFDNAALGVIKTDTKDTLKEKVYPAKIQPVKPKKEPLVDKEAVSPTLLPMSAQVSVLESGRSVTTDPATGSYSLLHAAGEYTVKAEAYGFESAEQSVTIEADGAAEADFTLEEVDQYTVSGTVTDQQTGEPISGASLLLVEDANVEPVTTDENGNYSLTAYEGTYTLKVVSSGYHGTEVEVSLADSDTTADVELEPFYTVPGGEIAYDDGTPENARAFYDAFNGWAVKMSLPEGEEAGVVDSGVFKFWDEEFPNPGGTAFQVEVWDASGPDGAPGEKLAGPFDAEANRDKDAWTVVDLSEHGITVDGDFYMVYIQTAPNTGAPGLATDESSPNAERSYQLVGGAWSKSPANEGNYMIRARVNYEVEEPVITSPAEDMITNETELTVEGTASPTTTVQLMNNGEEAGTAEIGDDGSFAIPVELMEGANELTAVSLLDGTPTGESDPVTVTLDTESPELTIDSPKDGEKSNRETVTVEGSVSDTNLDFVEVNGQEAAVEDGMYSKRILLENGENEIEVIAHDLAGNTSTESVTIDVDFTAPEIENLTPEEDVTLEAGETVKFEFDSEPGLRATYFIHMPLTNTVMNATELPMMETSDGHYVGYWTATSNVVAEGAVIEVKVEDDYGNETREQAEGKLFINVEE
ncbi:S8 family serine peptidase [Agaribacter marinus]|uniref:S8 family serine peptidase n=2 Tax=Bacillaceae TaxID=186817 RepID=A0A941DS84_9BACI|nr:MULTISPECIES: S8 family peptidase [Virgibacillus]MBR7794557.1 S8 family serine peptidase [Virgibacillus salarius]MDY7043348.1 S8 family serine peptidase [Virgibacillus sp. M23]NAZ07279.1 S8 family serine peptidase [Agaribacter marinus]